MAENTFSRVFSNPPPPLQFSRGRQTGSHQIATFPPYAIYLVCDVVLICIFVKYSSQSAVTNCIRQCTFYSTQALFQRDKEWRKFRYKTSESRRFHLLCSIQIVSHTIKYTCTGTTCTTHFNPSSSSLALHLLTILWVKSMPLYIHTYNFTNVGRFSKLLFYGCNFCEICNKTHAIFRNTSHKCDYTISGTKIRKKGG